MPCVHPAVSLGVVAPELARSARCTRVERLEKTPTRGLRPARAHESYGLVEHVAPASRPLRRVAPAACVAEKPGEMRYAPPVVCVLEGAGYIAVADVESVEHSRLVRNVAVLPGYVPCELVPFLVACRHRLHGKLEDALAGDRTEALRPRVDEDGDRVDSDHVVALATPEGPHGKVSVSLAVQDHRLHEPVHAFRHDERVERMRRAESVPEGERGVVASTLRARDTSVVAAVASVNVRDVVRLYAEAVERRVPACLLLVGPLFHDSAGQQPVPCRTVRGGDGLEVHACGFGIEVAARAFYGYGGERDARDEGTPGREGQLEAVAARLGGVRRLAARLGPRTVEPHDVVERVGCPAHDGARTGHLHAVV